MSSVQLLGNLYQISGSYITGQEDAAGYALLNERNEALLIDIGSVESYPKIMRSLGEIGVGASDIKLVLPTHIHRDHVSALAMLTREEGCNAELLTHPLEKQAAETGDYNMTAAFYYHRPSPPLKVAGTIEDRDAIEWGASKITAIHVPGHTPACKLLRVEMPEGTVDITGDALWGFFHPKIGSNVSAWQQSLQLMHSLPESDYVTFGHGINYLVGSPRAFYGKALDQFNPSLLPDFEKFPHHEPVNIWSSAQSSQAREKVAANEF